VLIRPLQFSAQYSIGYKKNSADLKIIREAAKKFSQRSLETKTMSSNHKSGETLYALYCFVTNFFGRFFCHFSMVLKSASNSPFLYS
jgi:hypothetical protein